MDCNGVVKEKLSYSLFQVPSLGVEPGEYADPMIVPSENRNTLQLRASEDRNT